MIVLQCSRCGHQIEVSDSLRGREIRCARCGNPLTPRAAAAPSTEVGVPPILTPLSERDARALSEAATNHVRDEDTLTPRSGVRDLLFSFLSPAQGPDELGWLAQYRIVRLLGQGGMGMVFEAIDTKLERTVALKVIKPEYARDQAARERFLREARAMAAVKSDYVVTVHHVGEANDLPFLAMEFLQGEPLDEWMKRRGRPNTDEIVRLASQIARGLAAAHQGGLIHRDIKPANIFIEIGAAGPTADLGKSLTVRSPQLPRGEAASDLDGDAWANKRTMVQARGQLLGLPSEFRVKILDFGLARIAHDPSHHTDPGLLMGTPGYMAPEQIEGKAVDARSDLFSLGCLLYELSTGEPPFTAASPMATLMAVLGKAPKPIRERNPGLPSALCTLIEHLMAKSPKDRPATALEVVAALEAIPARACLWPNAELLTPIEPALARRRHIFAIIALIVALAAATISLWLLRN